MVMVGVRKNSLTSRLVAQVGWLGVRVGNRTRTICLHSSNTPGELSHSLCHDDSTINNVIIVIIATGIGMHGSGLEMTSLLKKLTVNFFLHLILRSWVSVTLLHITH